MAGMFMPIQLVPSYPESLPERDRPKFCTLVLNLQPEPDTEWVAILKDLLKEERPGEVDSLLSRGDALFYFTECRDTTDGVQLAVSALTEKALDALNAVDEMVSEANRQYMEAYGEFWNANNDLWVALHTFSRRGQS